MPQLDIVDTTFIVAPVWELRAILCDEDRWHALGLKVTCYEDRGMQGKRWTLSGALTGTAEIWLEPAFGGVIVHSFIQADAVGRARGGRLRRRFAKPLKRWILEVKRRHDAHRPAGSPGVAGTSMDPPIDEGE